MMRSFTHGLILFVVLVARPAMSQCIEAEVEAPNPGTPEFGKAVSIHGDWAVVGSDGEGIDVFERIAGAWTLHSSIPAPAEATSAWGEAIALCGDVIVVGDEFDDGLENNGGAAHVYRRDGATWAHEQKLTGSDTNAVDEFGHSVAIENDVIAIGAWNADPTGMGAVYIFRHEGAMWIEEQKLPGLGVDGLFGDAVAISGDRIANTSPGGPDKAAFVYEFNDGQWSQGVQLEFVQNSDSIAISADVVVVGRPQSGSDVFRFNGSDWVFEQLLNGSDAEGGSDFGASVSVNGDHIVVGAPGHDHIAGNSGAAYVFSYDGFEWIETAEFAGPTTSVQAGAAVAMAGNTLLIGLPGPPGAVWFVTGLVGEDCNANGQADFCDLLEGTSLDCNLNEIVDECDIADGTSPDLNINGIPDECEPDCNDNGLPDFVDIEIGLSGDCNFNQVPDECDIASGYSADDDGDGVPDECGLDCNGNDVPD